MRTTDKNAYLATAIGRLLSENTGAAFISTAASIAILRERTGTAVTDAALQKLLTEMARVRGMTMLLIDTRSDRRPGGPQTPGSFLAC